MRSLQPLAFAGALLMTCAAGSGRPLAAATRSLVRDGGFEQAPAVLSPAWIAHGPCQVVGEQRHGGKQALRIAAGSLVEQTIFALQPGAWYACSGWLRTRDVEPTGAGGHAYLAVYQYDDSGSLVEFADFAQATGTTEWTRYTHVFQVSAAATWVSIRAGIWQAAGEAWVDDVTLMAGREPAEWAPALEAPLVPPDREERVAILRDDFPAAGAPSSPEHLASLLRGAGIETHLVSADELADGSKFNRANFDLVILPYGPTFPVAAQRTFQQFLAEGGDFITTGGYAFDNLVIRTARGWLPQAQALKARQERIAIGGDFEDALWPTDFPQTCALVSDVAHSGASCLRVSVPAGAVPLGGGCYREIKVEPGQEFVFSGWIRAASLGREADGFAYLAAYQYAADGRLVTFRDIAHVSAPQDWRRYEWRFRIAAGATTLRLIAGLYNTSGTAWFDDLALVRVPREARINTRSGEPGDGLQVSPTQIGVFDPSYPLERAAYACGSGEGGVFGPEVRITGPLEGYAASGVVGWNQARWVSLINAFDRYGRLRGSVGALLRNYAGVYARSSWAFFGVTSQDLFAPGQREMEQGLVRLVRLMLAETYLHGLETDRACYRQGEEVKLTVRVSNFSLRERNAAVAFEVEAQAVGARQMRQAQRDRVRLDRVARVIAPGETAILEARWAPRRFDANFYRVRATLALDGEEADRMETGFCVSDDRALRRGPQVGFKGNYIEAGGARHFLLGTDTYGNMFGSAAHNPLSWARDLGMMRDHGITVYENLQVNPAGFSNPYVPEDRFARQARAMAQLAQQLGLIYVPGLLIGWDTAATEEQLNQQAAWCESFARMLAQTPGIIYYTNGDLRLEIPDTPEMRALYAEFLRARYAMPEALQQAWQADPAITAFEQVTLERLVSRGWDDLRARDRKLFEWYLVRRWLTAMHRACKGADPDRPTTVEFYGQPFGGIDIRAALGPIDIANMGYFGLRGSDIAQFPAQFKFSDMRAYGQGLSIGEFGCKTHPAWAETRDYHQTRTEQQQLDLYLAVPHYALGLGGCKVHNWCWADAEEGIFPWGLVHSNDRVPKRVLAVYRNVALLFKHFEPRYSEPPVWLVVPTSHRAGANGDQVYQALLRCIAGLIGAHVDFGVIDEERLGEALPDRARLLLWPLPYCPDDEAVNSVHRFVERGGYAYISGDFSLDADRRRTRTIRLRRLAGVRFCGENFRGLALPDAEGPEARVDGLPWHGLVSWRGWPAVTVREAGAQVIARGAAGEPRLVVNRIGRGSVIYTPDALEAAPDAEQTLARVYRALLDFAGIARLGVAPDAPQVHAFRIPTRAGGAAYVLVNAGAADTRITLRTARHAYNLALGREHAGLVLEDGRGRTLAVEASGSVCRDGELLVSATGRFIVAAEDGCDLGESQELLLMPLEPGAVVVRFSAKAADLAAQVGEVQGGRWTALETFDPRGVARGVRVDLDPDRAVSLILLAPRHRLASLGERVARTLTNP